MAPPKQVFEDSLISPRDFGRLEAEVQALQVEVAALRNDMKLLLEAVNNVKGGWRTVVVFGSVLAALASMVAWWAEHTGRVP